MAFWHRLTRRDRSAGDESPAAPTGSHLPAERAERALIALAVHAGQIAERVERLEARLDGVADTDLAYATHDDLLDVRLHGARLAGEIARLNIALRAEIEQAFEKAKAVRTPTPHEQRTSQLAETIVDLSDRIYDAAPAPERLDEAV